MFDAVRSAGISTLVALLGFLAAPTAHAQSDASGSWQVAKSSGEVWVTSTGVQPASLGDQAALKAGDAIRTGRNGRVLLKRGEETILIAPNSVVALPGQPQQDSGTTTIIQQAGSILLDVEKRNVKHFEVETPYLVAAVKGTQFRVSVGNNESTVAVLRGEVEVADLKTGQYASVLPGQSAKVTIDGRGGLSLGGTGTLNPIRQGQPRPPSAQRVPVPRAGLTAPTRSTGQHVRALGAGGGIASGLRIGAALGEVRLDIQKVTNGLAREAAVAAGSAGKQSVWSTGELTPGNGVGKSYNLGNNGSGNGNGSANGSSGGNGNAYGANNSNAGGNGNGSAYGLNGGNGVGNAYGLGNGNANGHARK
jgi:hypothetical protein